MSYAPGAGAVTPRMCHRLYTPHVPSAVGCLPTHALPLHHGRSPHCLAAGGPGAVSQNSALTWPDGRAGLCGDMYDGPRDHEAGGRYATGGLTSLADERMVS